MKKCLPKQTKSKSKQDQKQEVQTDKQKVILALTQETSFLSMSFSLHREQSNYIPISLKDNNNSQTAPKKMADAKTTGAYFFDLPK